MSRPESFAVRASRGANLLDQVRPGWAYNIDLGRLNMEDVEHCVLGQLYGDYYQADLGVAEREEDYGFDDDDPEGFHWLTLRWRQEVRRRTWNAVDVDGPS